MWRDDKTAISTLYVCNKKVREKENNIDHASYRSDIAQALYRSLSVQYSSLILSLVATNPKNL